MSLSAQCLAAGLLRHSAWLQAPRLLHTVPAAQTPPPARTVHHEPRTRAAATPVPQPPRVAAGPAHGCMVLHAMCLWAQRPAGGPCLAAVPAACARQSARLCVLGCCPARCRLGHAAPCAPCTAPAALCHAARCAARPRRQPAASLVSPVHSPPPAIHNPPTKPKASVPPPNLATSPNPPAPHPHPDSLGPALGGNAGAAAGAGAGAASRFLPGRGPEFLPPSGLPARAWRLAGRRGSRGWRVWRQLAASRHGVGGSPCWKGGEIRIGLCFRRRRRGLSLPPSLPRLSRRPHVDRTSAARRPRDGRALIASRALPLSRPMPSLPSCCVATQHS